jgi:hypothetical protein
VKKEETKKMNASVFPLAHIMLTSAINVVAIFSVRLIKSTLRSLRRLRVSMRSLSERPRRPSFHTITVSPARTNARSSSSPFLSNFDPVILSLKSFSQPVSFRASL